MHKELHRPKTFFQLRRSENGITPISIFYEKELYIKTCDNAITAVGGIMQRVGISYDRRFNHTLYRLSVQTGLGQKER
jgi:hypothetical protein